MCDLLSVLPPQSSSFHKKGDEGGLSPGGSSSGGSSSKRSGGYGTLPKHHQHYHQSHQQYHHHHHNHSGGSHNHSGSSSGSKEELRVEIRSGSAGADTSISSSGSKKSRSGFHGLGKTLMRVRSGKRSSSAPNLGDQSAGLGDCQACQHGRNSTLSCAILWGGVTPGLSHGSVLFLLFLVVFFPSGTSFFSLLSALTSVDLVTITPRPSCYCLPANLPVQCRKFYQIIKILKVKGKLQFKFLLV